MIPALKARSAQAYRLKYYRLWEMAWVYSLSAGFLKFTYQSPYKIRQSYRG